MNGRLANDLQDQMQYLTLTREDEVYGINRIRGQAMLRENEVTPVPVAPHYVGGIINPGGYVSKVTDVQQQIIGILAGLDKLLNEAGSGEISSP